MKLPGPSCEVLEEITHLPLPLPTCRSGIDACWVTVCGKQLRGILGFDVVALGGFISAIENGPFEGTSLLS